MISASKVQIVFSKVKNKYNGLPFVIKFGKETKSSYQKIGMILLFLLFGNITAWAQSPSVEFLKGLDLLSVDRKLAKKQFKNALLADSLYAGTYHFLGVLSLEENQVDEAIGYFEKSLFLNLDNQNHTREITFSNLIDAHLQQHNFEEAFRLAHIAYKQYPANKVMLHALQDISLWSFYITHNQLNPSYLSKDLQDEYLVNSVSEQYLILRNILIDRNYLLFQSQEQFKKNRNWYHLVRCELSHSDETVDVLFRLNWNLKKFEGGKVVDTEKVYANTKLPIHERIGALLISNPDIDLLKEIEKLENESN